MTVNGCRTVADGKDGTASANVAISVTSGGGGGTGLMAQYFDAALVIAVLGFLGTTAIAKYLLKGDIID